LPVKIECDTGGMARVHEPVSVELRFGKDVPESARGWFADAGKAGVVLRQDGKEIPAQLESLVDENNQVCGARISWIIESAAAGKTLSYVPAIQSSATTGATEKFVLIDKAGEHLDCFFGNRPVYRYVYRFDPDNFHDTYKPFHHVCDFEGEYFITKGPGGMDSHHRGMYIGWNETKVGGKSYDFWSMGDKSTQRHKAFVPQATSAGPVLARRAALVDWVTPDGEPVVRDRRETVVYRQPEGRRLFDMLFLVEPLKGPTRLDGHLHHAGFHFRADNEVAFKRASSRYVLPPGVKRVNDQADGPWAVGSFVMRDKRYAILHMSGPANPNSTVYSTRDYGRFGAFFQTGIDIGKPLVLQYRVLVIPVKDVSELDQAAFVREYENYVKPPVVRVSSAG